MDTRSSPVGECRAPENKQDKESIGVTPTAGLILTKEAREFYWGDLHIFIPERLVEVGMCN